MLFINTYIMFVETFSLELHQYETAWVHIYFTSAVIATGINLEVWYMDCLGKLIWSVEELDIKVGRYCLLLSIYIYKVLILELSRVLSVSRVGRLECCW